MKITAILALATAALAAEQVEWCKPGTYRCSWDASGWEVCGAGYQWVYAGSCGAGQVCKYWAASQSPYCVPPWYQFS
ncbi:hypothetical protein QBC47DRAFT_407147 [Echria macrotheca]|uniref:Uncharacterized protein n=1 Tax=Echria macrotheca TaxID=438768 RepID=A0AAJ0B1Z2_9PEZI|nr:hypothetical protein QBC47DRAFT_407147 [Echria macrotheca]